MKKERKKRRTTCLSFFCARRNGDCSRKFRGHQTITARSATQTASPPKTSRAIVVFRGHLQTSPYDVRITTKIGTTCTYYREILTARARAPRSSRTTVQQKIFVSEKFRQKQPSGSSSGIYFRQTDRSFCLRSFGSLAYRLASHSWLFLIPHLSFWGKFSQEFNLVKKLLWRKRRN